MMMTDGLNPCVKDETIRRGNQDTYTANVGASRKIRIVPGLGTAVSAAALPPALCESLCSFQARESFFDRRFALGT